MNWSGHRIGLWIQAPDPRLGISVGPLGSATFGTVSNDVGSAFRLRRSLPASPSTRSSWASDLRRGYSCRGDGTLVGDPAAKLCSYGLADRLARHSFCCGRERPSADSTGIP